jgi:hypothetical protein
VRWPLVAWLAGLTCAAGLARDTSFAKADPSEEFFTNARIARLRIEITGTNLTELRRNNRNYVRATVREGDTIYRAVGIHLKGAAGSFRGLEDRPALTLNFDKFEPGQSFHGLDKIHLNNSVQDPSYMTEILCGELFRAAGVPAPRGTPAWVELNGRDLGLYVLKEGFDKTFLRRYFKNANGNLYDGGFLREITEPLYRNSGEGDVPRYAELKDLAAAALEPDPAKRIERLKKVLDLDRFVSFIAMEIVTWHWDGYAMKKNNYRVYHDPAADKIVFFPHGMDQMFWAPNGSILPYFEGLVARQLVEAPEGKRQYRARMAELLTNVFRVEVLTNRLAELQTRIRPALAAISPEAARQHDGAVYSLRNQIVQRARYLERVLLQPEPKPLQFSADGFAPVRGWSKQVLASESPELEQTAGPDGRRSLRIAVGADGKCTSSWRARVELEPGRYRFEARVRTRGVVPLPDPPARTPKGEGAGVRVSGSRQARPNKVIGDTDWQTVEYEFQVEGPSKEVELVCELRATRGEAWFDFASLRLKKK